MSKRGVRVLAAVVLLIAAVFAIRQFIPASDGFAAFRPTSGSELARRPEAHMYFPGSVLLDQSTRDMTGPLLSTGGSAGVFTIAATGASKNQVIAWYQDQMQSRGWSPNCGEVCNPATPGWSRGNREVFFLYFLGTTSPDYRSTTLPTEYSIGYHLAASLGIDELYCFVFRPPPYTGPPTGRHFLC